MRKLVYMYKKKTAYSRWSWDVIDANSFCELDEAERVEYSYLCMAYNYEEALDVFYQYRTWRWL